MRSRLKVSVSGVRGVVGESLTPGLIANFTASFGEYVGGGRVVVGRDTRPTGAMYEHAVVAGLLSSGCQPMLLGVVPTPTIQIIVDKYNANGGIAITASHNPVEWNALKFIGASGIFLNHTEATELLHVYNQPDKNYVGEPDYRQIRSLANAFEFHKRKIFGKVDCERICRANFKVAVDCCNGAGALYSEDFLRELGCRVHVLHNNPEVPFERKPEPAPENLTLLRDLVLEQGCDIGFAQDPDADRLVVIGNNGVALGEQYTLAVVVAHILSKTPGHVVVNIQTTKAIEEIATQAGCPTTYSKVGEINVTSDMLAVKAVIGGEGSSGGIIWPAVHPCRDSFSGMALILEMMAERAATIADIVSDLPRYYSCNAKYPCAPEKAFQVMRRLKQDMAENRINTIDGLRIDWDDAWLLIRPSNTEPIMRIAAEAKEPQRAQALVAQFLDIIERLHGGV